jgi:hypothetical protein
VFLERHDSQLKVGAGVVKPWVASSKMTHLANCLRCTADGTLIMPLSDVLYFVHLLTFGPGVPGVLTNSAYLFNIKPGHCAVCIQQCGDTSAAAAAAAAADVEPGSSS